LLEEFLSDEYLLDLALFLLEGGLKFFLFYIIVREHIFDLFLFDFKLFFLLAFLLDGIFILVVGFLIE
jgi:hypothetical protein